jgi:hypothetical protein
LLEKEVTAEEIKATIFSMKSNKALGMMDTLLIFLQPLGQLLGVM